MSGNRPGIGKSRWERWVGKWEELEEKAGAGSEEARKKKRGRFVGAERGKGKKKRNAGTKPKTFREKISPPFPPSGRWPETIKKPLPPGTIHFRGCQCFPEQQCCPVMETLKKFDPLKCIVCRWAIYFIFFPRDPRVDLGKTTEQTLQEFFQCQSEMFLTRFGELLFKRLISAFSGKKTPKKTKQNSQKWTKVRLSNCAC